MNETQHLTDETVNKIYNSQHYKSYTRKKSQLIRRLIIISLILYFSDSILNIFIPGVMNYPVAGSLNVGLIWVIFQYPLGGLIAWYYVKKMRTLDHPHWLSSLTGRS